MTHPSQLRRVGLELWHALATHRRRASAAFALLVAAKLVGVAVPLLLKAVIDRLGLQVPGAAGGAAADPAASMSLVLVMLLLGYALLRFGATLFTELRDLVFARVAQQVVIGFSQRCFAHVLDLGPRFHVQRDTGSLIRDVERGTAGVGFLLGAGLFTIVPTLVEFGAVLGVLAVGYELWFSLIVVATFLVYAGYTMQLTRRRTLRQRKVNEMDSRAHSRLVDTLLNYDVVKSHARERYEAERYRDICVRWIETAIGNQRALSALHIGQGAIIAAGVAGVMLLAGERTVRGAMTVGDLVLLNAYILQICLPLNALGFVFRETRDALVNIEKVFALLDQRPEIADAPDAQPLRVTGGTVRFEAVQFGYEPGRRILSDLSLDIDAGHTLAVVGGSGSGKSTLARLLLRMYDPDGGRVTVDGQDLRSLRLDSLRNFIGVVPQDTLLFNDSIAYNIGYGRPGAPRAEIVAAAQAAQVHEFVLSLPEQYDTLVGERGMKLSGGERQRLAIARAFLKNPPILIFDEATSALDTRAERAIQGELDRISQGRTTLIIAHRLSTVVNADQIVVMDKGRIVERGRHEELLQQAGLYAQLWALQRQQEQVERLERQLARQAVNLVALAANALDAVRAEIDARNVRLYANIDMRQARVIGDPGTLTQVLLDVLRTALRATGPGGRLELSLEARDGQAALSISDSRHDGAAPLPVDHEEPVDPLALRSLIERQGGRFVIEPRSATVGTRYRIELPLRAAEGPAPMPASPVSANAGPVEAMAQGGPLAGLCVLCVEAPADSATVAANGRPSLARLFASEGARVLVLESAADARVWLAQHPAAEWPQAIACDLRNTDGHALLRSVRRLEAERGIPLSRRVPALAFGDAQQDDEQQMRALLSGFQLLLTGPLRSDELARALRALLGGPRFATLQP